MKGTPVTEEIYQYMLELFPAEDGLLRQLCSDAVAAGIPAIQISPEQGAFIQTFLRAIGARRVLEIGTLAGYSAIMMARALPAGGRVVSVEYQPMHADFARSYAAKAGLEHTIEIHTGAATDVLQGELAGSGPYDFAFIDADKLNYTRYMELILPMMRSGGVIAGDNALAWGKVADQQTDDPDVPGIQAFNRAMASSPLITSCSIVPVGDGMCIGVVK